MFPLFFLKLLGYFYQNLPNKSISLVFLYILSLPTFSYSNNPASTNAFKYVKILSIIYIFFSFHVLILYFKIQKKINVPFFYLFPYTTSGGVNFITLLFSFCFIINSSSCPFLNILFRSFIYFIFFGSCNFSNIILQ